MSDRKYRQPGYQDRRDEPARKSSQGPPPKREESFGPRAIQMAATRAVSRCSQCGALLQGLAEPPGACPKCKFELHSCKQCTHFDPARRFECSQQIPLRIPRKDALNDCTLYSMRVMVEKETSTSAPVRLNDARQAFENLFKK